MRVALRRHLSRACGPGGEALAVLRDDAQNGDLGARKNRLDGCAREAEARLRMGEKRRGVEAGGAVLRYGREASHERPERCRGERRAAGVVHFDPEARELGANPPSRLTIRRDQRRCPILRFERFAHEESERERLQVFIGGFDKTYPFERSGGVGAEAFAKAAPHLRRVGRTQRLRDEAASRCERRASLAERFHFGPVDPELTQQTLQHRLRMGEGWFAPIADRIADMTPAIFIEILIEARQDHGAARLLRNRGEKPRGRRIGAGRAQRDDGMALGLGMNRPDLRLEQRLCARRAIDDAALFERRWPLAQRDPQKVSGNRPIAVEGLLRAAEDGFGLDSLDDELVDQRAEFLGEGAGVWRARRDEEGVAKAGAVRRDDGAFERARPSENELGERQAAIDLIDRRRGFVKGRLYLSGEKRRALDLVERAERQNARYK